MNFKRRALSWLTAPLLLILTFFIGGNKYFAVFHSAEDGHRNVVRSNADYSNHLVETEAVNLEQGAFKPELTCCPCNPGTPAQDETLLVANEPSTVDLLGSNEPAMEPLSGQHIGELESDVDSAGESSISIHLGDYTVDVDAPN